MARTKQTARKSTGGKRPRVQMSSIVRTPKADEFLSELDDMLYRASHEFDPLKHIVVTGSTYEDDRKPMATKTTTTLKSSISSSSLSSSSWQDQGQQVLSMLMQHRISEYMDVQTITTFRLTSVTNWHQHEATWETTVCRTFLLTTDMKQAAEQVVRGGWKAFLQFLSPLAHTIESTFGQMGLSAPPLYRALMAQQALRRLDKSPHPLLSGSDWSGEYKGKVFRSHWKYQIPEFSVEVR